MFTGSAPSKITRESLVAAEIFGIHFAGDESCLKQLTDRIKFPDLDSITVIALCEGWPNAEVLRKFFDYLRDSKEGCDSITTHQLVCTFQPANTVIRMTRKYVNNRRDPYPGTSSLARPLLRRLQSDTELQGLMWRVLEAEPTPSERCSYPSLLTETSGLTPELRSWCYKESPAPRFLWTPDWGYDPRKERVS
jgi:hypothetical protein